MSRTAGFYSCRPHGGRTLSSPLWEEACGGSCCSCITRLVSGKHLSSREELFSAFQLSQAGTAACLLFKAPVFSYAD